MSLVSSLLSSLKLAAAIEKTNGDREEKLQNQDVDLGLDAPIFDNSKSFVLDSFEDDQHRDHITNEVKLSCNIVEADEPSTDKDINLPSPQKDCAVEDARNESFVYHVETSNSKNVLSQANMDLDKMLLDRDACISESVLDCRSSSKEVFSKKTQDNFANLNKNSTVAEIHPVEKDLKNEPESTEGNAISPIFFCSSYLVFTACSYATSPIYPFCAWQQGQVTTLCLPLHIDQYIDLL